MFTTAAVLSMCYEMLLNVRIYYVVVFFHFLGCNLYNENMYEVISGVEG